MARPRKAPTDQTRIATFAKDELEVLVDKLYEDLNFKTTAPTVLGALVLAARRLPAEVVQALIPAYVARERDELSAAAEREDADSNDR